ncbi:MAG: HYR domain-containing protein [Acidobacteriota bacterium]
MNAKLRILIVTTLVIFAVGVWLVPSQAQRSPQRSAPARAGKPSKSLPSRAARARQKEGPVQVLTPVVAQAVDFAESVPVRDLPRPDRSISSAKPGPPEVEPREVNEKNSEETRKEVSGIKGSFDGALQTAPRSFAPNVLPAASLTFEGVAFADGNNVAPPDTNGDVGPNHFVQTVNNRVGIWDKSGNLLVPFFKQSSLFAPLGGLAATVDQGDPIVLYDRIADRWLISQFAFTALNAPPYHEAIAISKTGDPTGAYYLYDFILPGNEFPDYPKFGVWPDGYYMATNQFTNGGPFNGAGAFAFDRKKMILGDPTASLIYFSLNLSVPFASNGIFGMLPSDQDGLLPPPAGAPNVYGYFTADEFGDVQGDAVRLFNFHADYVTPASSTFTERAESPLVMSAFDPRNPNGRGDIEQPPPAGNNATDRLDSLSIDTMYRLQYFNRGGTESLVSNFTVNVSGVTPSSAAAYQAGFRYFELRKAAPAAPYAIVEQATFAPAPISGATGSNRWMGSAAIDNQENLAVGFSISSTTIFPSLNYAGRAFNDAPNGLQGEVTLFAGVGVQRGTSNRWGDYSSMQIDPADDCSFWFTSEYYTTNNLTFNWRTRIAKFKFPTCTAPPQGTLSGTVTACDTGAPLQFALVEVSGGPSDGFSAATIANGTYSKKLAPGTYSVTFSAAGHACAPAGPITVIIIDGQTTTLNQCLSGAAKFVAQSSALSGGDGDGIIERNECNNLNVTIKNDGCLTGSNVSAVLSSTTPGVTITQANSPYPATPENGTATNTVPYSFSTSAAFVCGTPITFTLTVTFTGGTSTFSFTLPTCGCPTTTITGSLAAGDLTQTGRMGRTATLGSCTSVKACPGAIAGDTNQHRYDLHTFVNGPTAACVTITTTTTCVAAPNDIITVAYLGTFNPTNLCTNYLNDPGGSPNPSNSFTVNVPAGGTLLVNVHEITANAGCSSYTISVSGLVCDTAGNGACGACQITCPANITVPNDTNQCGAVVTYAAPGTTGTCGTVTCSPASGSFFPRGTTTVTCTTTAGPTCTFTVTVNDTQPPTITCPVNITAVTATAADPCVVVSFASPTASDNCPGVVVVCNPPSGSCFPVGVTTVTCTATDASNNTATCTFTISVFNGRLQDDSAGCNNTVLFNTLTGDYRWCCNGTIYAGRATVSKAGNNYTLTHQPPDRRVLIKLLAGSFPPSGSGSLQSPPGLTRCSIQDRDTRNDTCICGAGAPKPTKPN